MRGMRVERLDHHSFFQQPRRTSDLDAAIQGGIWPYDLP